VRVRRRRTLRVGVRVRARAKVRARALTVHVLVAPGALVTVARLPRNLDAVLEVGHVLREEVST
jgi:hypothetical protein